jgi:hypothetical protein
MTLVGLNMGTVKTERCSTEGIKVLGAVEFGRLEIWMEVSDKDIQNGGELWVSFTNSLANVHQCKNKRLHRFKRQ